MKHTGFKGSLIGCYKMQQVWKDLSPEEKNKIKEDVKAYPHMTPCPQEKMYWVIKENSCRYCPFVLVDNQEVLSEDIF